MNDKTILDHAAERRLLGAAMENASVVENAFNKGVTATTFENINHGAIWSAIVACWFAGQPVTPDAVGRQLLAAGDLARIGGAGYLAQVYRDGSVLDTHADYYIGLVLDAQTRRRLRQYGAELTAAADLPDPNVVSERVEAIAQELSAPELGPTLTTRRVDLSPFLDGTYTPPTPAIGGLRDDGQSMLYPGRWHTMIAPTTSGKSWYAIWHCISEIRAGRTVAYAHFEEYSPAGTIDRIRLVAPDLTNEIINSLFVWVDCSKRWKHAEWTRALPDSPSLVILDGINAACGQHGWVVDKTEAVGSYREMFVAPAVTRGAAVLSLGHPPKSPDRQGERHGFGSTAWLDEVDGVGFRLKSSKDKPIRRGMHGLSNVYTVKDRYGQVEKLGKLDEEGSSEGWYYIGSLHVDSTPSRDNVVVYHSAPSATANGFTRSTLDKLADSALEVIAGMPHGEFPTLTDLKTAMRAAEIKHKAEDLPAALVKLQSRGLLDWPEAPKPKAARPGRITDLGSAEIQKWTDSSSLL